MPAKYRCRPRDVSDFARVDRLRGRDRAGRFVEIVGVEDLRARRARGDADVRGGTRRPPPGDQLRVAARALDAVRREPRVRAFSPGATASTGQPRRA